MENIDTQLQTLIKKEQIEAFRDEFLDLHPYDQAMFFMDQPESIRLRIYTYLSPEETADIMENIELDDIEPFFTEMDPRFAAMVFA